MWHWNVPTNDGNDYTCTPGTEAGETSFDVRKIFEPESDEYKLMMKDINTIISYLKLLKQRKIPVLWRPLHEAGGQWFWWGMDAEACNELWRVMYQRFQDAGLNNLIWVWTTAAAWNKPYSDGYKWYPGDEYVDIVSIDIYNKNNACRPSASCGKQAANGSSSFPGTITIALKTPTAQTSRVRTTHIATQNGGRRLSRTTMSSRVMTSNRSCKQV